MKTKHAQRLSASIRRIRQSKRVTRYSPLWAIGLILGGCGGGSPFTLPNMPNPISEKSLHSGPEVVTEGAPSTSAPDEGVYLQAARLFDSQGNIEEAARHYELAMQAAPGNTRIIVAYARLLDRDEKFEQAERMYWEALRCDPDNAGIHNDLGLCQARAGRLNESLQSLDQAVRLSPQDTRFRNNIAKVLVEVGRHEDGLRHLASVYPEAVAHHNLGFFLQEKQDSDLATRHFARALELDPTQRNMIESGGQRTP